MIIKALVATTLPVIALLMAPSAVAQPSQFMCPAQNGYVVGITHGNINCDEAANIAAQYDTVNGGKFQDIGGYTCYTGNAMTAPLLFTCVMADSPDGSQWEFGVYPG